MLKNLYNITELEKVLQEILLYPPLVSLGDIENFQISLKHSEFILHAGDCAESFGDFSLEYLNKQIDLLCKTASMRDNNIIILRGAGQFFKPRSNLYDHNGVLNYFGDGINDFNQNDRIPNPKRLQRAYFISAAKVNYLRQQKTQIFTSHEALFIPYEETFLKYDDCGRLFSSSAHMLWLGYRNAKIDSEQVKFLANIINPVGIKVGPDTDFDELSEILERLNPMHEDYKLILILRFGVVKAKESCVEFMKFISKIKQKVKVIIDPLHGNNVIHNFQKTRKICDILGECVILRDGLSEFDGVSLEMTPDDNLECIYDDHSIIDNKSLCDPRVNRLQMAEIMQKLYF